MTDKTPEQKELEERTFAAVEQMAEAMTGGIKKWEKVLYPMMIMFIILAAYGFYLIYQLAHDVRQISNNMLIMTRAVATMTSTVNLNMQKIDAQMAAINLTMDRMRRTMEGIKADTGVISEVMPSLHDQFASMNATMLELNGSVTTLKGSADSMARSLWELDQNISEPMNSINSVIPFGMMPKKKSRRVHNPPPGSNRVQPRYYPRYYYPQQPAYPAPAQPQQHNSAPDKGDSQDKE